MSIFSTCDCSIWPKEINERTSDGEHSCQGSGLGVMGQAWINRDSGTDGSLRDRRATEEMSLLTINRRKMRGTVAVTSPESMLRQTPIHMLKTHAPFHWFSTLNRPKTAVNTIFFTDLFLSFSSISLQMLQRCRPSWKSRLSGTLFSKFPFGWLRPKQSSLIYNDF